MKTLNLPIFKKPSTKSLNSNKKRKNKLKN